MSISETRGDLKQAIQTWIREAMRRQVPIPFSGGHDELNFMASWPAFAQAVGDAEILTCCKQFRDQLIAWPGLVHGFFPDARWDIEHSVENWTVFMTALAEADPDDAVTTDCLEHVAHHLGNWEPGVPDWFDWRRKRFISEYVGTEHVRDYPPYNYSNYWDARASELALTVWKLTGRQRYLEFAQAFAQGWAEHTLAQEGVGHWLQIDADLSDRAGFKQQYGDYPEDFKAHTANWMLECCRHLLHVYQLAGGSELQQAARKMLELGPSATLRSQETFDAVKGGYQEITGDTCFAADIAAHEQQVTAQARQTVAEPLTQLVILEEMPGHRKVMLIEEPGHREVWVPGARRFQAYYGPNEEIIPCQAGAPGSFLAAYRITGEEQFLQRATAQAAQELALCSSTLRDGRDHGCDGRYNHGPGRQAVQAFLASDPVKLNA